MSKLHQKNQLRRKQDAREKEVLSRPENKASFKGIPLKTPTPQKEDPKPTKPPETPKEPPSFKGTPIITIKTGADGDPEIVMKDDKKEKPKETPKETPKNKTTKGKKKNQTPTYASIFGDPTKAATPPPKKTPEKKDGKKEEPVKPTSGADGKKEEPVKPTSGAEASPKKGAIIITKLGTGAKPAAGASPTGDAGGASPSTGETGATPTEKAEEVKVESDASLLSKIGHGAWGAIKAPISFVGGLLKKKGGPPSGDPGKKPDDGDGPGKKPEDDDDPSKKSGDDKDDDDPSKKSGDDDKKSSDDDKDTPDDLNDEQIENNANLDQFFKNNAIGYGKNMFTTDSLQSLYDISLISVFPDEGCDTSEVLPNATWSYKNIKNAILPKYTVSNYPTSEYEKMKAKIAATPYVWNMFYAALKAIDARYKEFTENDSVKNYVAKNHQSLIGDLKQIRNTYRSKILSIRHGWYNDWRNYGDIKTLYPMLNDWDIITENQRGNLLKEIQETLTKVYDTCAPDDDQSATRETHPLRYWLEDKVKPALSYYPAAIKDPSKYYVRTDLYNKGIVSSYFNNLLNQANSIVENSILAAYPIIQASLDYIKPFATIDYSLNRFRNQPFAKRLESLELKPGFTYSNISVRTDLIKIYNLLADKVGPENKNTHFMKVLDTINHSYFKRYKTPIECLYQLYIISQGDPKNRAAYSIDNIAAMMELDDESLKKIYIAIKSSGGWKKWLASWVPNYRINWDNFGLFYE